MVDATQGVEAQTIANVYLAIANNLVIIPVINKIDLPSADVEGVKKQIHDVLGLDVSDTLLVSAKEGKGVREVVEAVIQRVPPPPVIRISRSRLSSSIHGLTTTKVSSF